MISNRHDHRALVANTVERDYPQLRRLKDLIDRHCAHDQVAVVQKALRDLFEIIALLAKKPLDDSSAHLIQTWPMDVGASMIDMLAAKDPVALVVLAHYAVILHHLHNLWWIRDWGTRILHEILDSVDAEWHELMRWPIDATGCVWPER